MKLTTLAKTLTLFGMMLFIVAADFITRDMIPKGTDVSTVKCYGRLVSIGDLSKDVLQICGEPIREIRILDEPYRIWVYRLDQADHVYYLEIMDEKLRRVFDVKCSEDSPDCK